MKESRILDFLPSVVTKTIDFVYLFQGSFYKVIAYLNYVFWIFIVWQLNALRYRRMDFGEFCAATVSVHQMEARDRWEHDARAAYEIFEKDGNRAIVIEELASVCFFFLKYHLWICCSYYVYTTRGVQKKPMTWENQLNRPTLIGFILACGPVWSENFKNQMFGPVLGWWKL